MLLDKLDVQPDAQQQQQQQSLELQLVQLEQQLAKGIDSVFGRCASSAVQLQYSCSTIAVQLQCSCSTVAVQLQCSCARFFCLGAPVWVAGRGTAQLS